MRIDLTKTVKFDLLREELLQAFPEWAAGEGMPGLRLLEFYQEEAGAYATIPDGSDTALFAAVVDAHDPSRQTEGEQFRSRIVTIAQSAVGIRLQDLTAAQIKSLMACLLYAAGGIDPETMTVRPLGEWLR